MLYTTRLQKITCIWCMVCFCFLYSCKQQPVNTKATEALPANARLVTVQLQDSLGTASFYVPNRLDTFFTWTDNSNCRLCGFEVYRLQDKSLPVYKETGFEPRLPQIPMHQFTMKHVRFYPFNKSDSQSLREAARQFKSEKEYMQLHTGVDSIISFNNRLWGVVSLSGYYKGRNRFTASLNVITQIHGNTIQFEYLRNQRDSFDTKPYFDSLWPLIRTIQLSEGM